MKLDNMRETIAAIMECRRKQDQCFRELLVWADAQAQGIDPATVERWGWDHDLIRPALWEKIKSILYSHVGISSFALREKHPWAGTWLVEGGKAMWFNYVVLKDGTKRVLEPYIQAAEGRELS